MNEAIARHAKKIVDELDTHQTDGEEGGRKWFI